MTPYLSPATSALSRSSKAWAHAWLAAAAVAWVVASAPPNARGDVDAPGEERATEERATDAPTDAARAPSEPAEASASIEAPPAPFALPAESPSASRGETSRGRLHRGQPMPSNANVRIKNAATAYGTTELVSLITWAARRVREGTGAGVLLVGDLSRPRGGRLAPHRSHRSGRDADLGFYLLDTEGNPVIPRRFVRMGSELTGRSRDGVEVRFDVARNWALVAALLSQDAVPVQYIMVVGRLKRALLTHAMEIGAPKWLLARAQVALGPRRSGRRRDGHNSHFHVRIFCADDDVRCVDRGRRWFWQVRRARQATR